MTGTFPAPILVECPACNGEGIRPVPSVNAPAPEEVECKFCHGLCQVTPQRADWYAKATARS